MSHDGGARRRRTLSILLLAIAFGAGMSAFKGNDAGIRSDIGNLSAPWLLLPFFAGAVAHGKWVRGAGIGLAATTAALGSFYATNAFVLDLGPHNALTDLGLAFGAYVYWLPLGLLSGAVFGALGAFWRHSGFPAVGVAVVLLLDVEPGFWAVADHLGGVASFAFTPALLVSIGEASVGIGLSACFIAIVPRLRHELGPYDARQQP